MVERPFGIALGFDAGLLQNASTSPASAGEPGAGYCNWYSAGGKPPKSCHVAGCASVPTRTSGAIQCGDMMSTPRRPGNWVRSAAPQRVKAGPVSPASSANSGAPWDTYSAGRLLRGREMSWEEVDMVGFQSSLPL